MGQKEYDELNALVHFRSEILNYHPEREKAKEIATKLEDRILTILNKQEPTTNG